MTHLSILLGIVIALAAAVQVVNNEGLAGAQKFIPLVVYALVTPGILTSILCYADYLTTRNTERTQDRKSDVMAWVVGLAFSLIVILLHAALSDTGFQLVPFGTFRAGPSAVGEVIAGLAIGFGFRFFVDRLVGTFSMSVVITLLVWGALSGTYFFFTAGWFRPAGLFLVLGGVAGALICEMVSFRILAPPKGKGDQKSGT